MSNIHTNSLSSLLQTFIKGAEERAEEEGLVAIVNCLECIHPRKQWLDNWLRSLYVYD